MATFTRVMFRDCRISGLLLPQGLLRDVAVPDCKLDGADRRRWHQRIEIRENIAMSDPIERHLLEEIKDGIAELKRDLGYNPTYFIRMVAELGPAVACRQLVRSNTPSDGFTFLWSNDRLAMTVEALVLLPWYESLFDDKIRADSRRRLTDYQFDVDAYLASAIARLPVWTADD